MRLLLRGHSFVRAILSGIIWAGLISGVIFPRALVAAQDDGTIHPGSPDTTQFPVISFFMEAYNAHGGFIHDLQPADVQVLENGELLKADALTLSQPGLQFILAFNNGPQMAKRGSSGASLYETIQKHLLSWAQNQHASTDDFTLITNDGLQTIRQAEPQRWMQEISAYQPDLNQSKPGLGSLTQALDIATDPNPRPNMKRVLLYITVPPTDNSISALPNLTGRANQMGLSIFVWVASPDGKASSPGVDALRQMAEQTGGALFLYSGSQTLPDPEAYLRPLRYIYQVTYTSAIQQGGTQRMTVVIGDSSSESTIVSDEQVFNINILPPNPIFLAPPAQIERTFPKNRRNAPAEPGEMKLNVLVEFPDGYPRALRSSSLFVDDVKVAENNSAPYDSFAWDLTAYDTSATHILKVEVEDILGMRQSSAEIAVEVQVEPPRGLALLQNIQPQRIMIAVAILLAALALGLVLWLGGRRRLQIIDRKQRQALKDPVTQPVPIQQDQPRRKPVSREHPSWPRPAALPKSPAWLVPVDDGSQPLPGANIPVQRREITFGSNPRQATCVLNVPSIDHLHARLYQPREGEYYLADAGSVAGTWVNYAPASADGTRLEHGDLISIGQITFRFELANPAALRKPKVTENIEPE